MPRGLTSKKAHTASQEQNTEIHLIRATAEDSVLHRAAASGAQGVKQPASIEDNSTSRSWRRLFSTPLHAFSPHAVHPETALALNAEPLEKFASKGLQTEQCRPETRPNNVDEVPYLQNESRYLPWQCANIQAMATDGLLLRDTVLGCVVLRLS